MGLLQRKAFLKMGLATASGAVAAACGMAGGSSDDDGMIIHVRGTLSSDPPGAAPANQIDATVTGMGADLSGSGRSYFEVSDVSTVVASASMWSVRGSRVKDLIRLKGVTILANTPDILGAPVTRRGRREDRCRELGDGALSQRLIPGANSGFQRAVDRGYSRRGHQARCPGSEQGQLDALVGLRRHVTGPASAE